MPDVSDGTISWELGQDAWLSPNQIRPNQYAAGVNLSTRGGVLGPRSPFHRFEMGFAATTVETDYHYQRNIENIWSAGKFQALIAYAYGADDFLISVICGLIFQTNIQTNKTILLSDKIRLNQYAPRVNWVIGGDVLTLFDYPDYPVLIKGDDVSRADPDHIVNGNPEPQCPIAVLGAYNQSRVFIADAGNAFTAGDAVGNEFTPEAPNTFAEILTPGSPFFEQFFALGTGTALHPITAMGFVQQLDISTGVGALFVATDNQIYSYQTQNPRENWSGPSFGSLYISNAGIAGPRAFVNVNSDVIFLSGAGNVHAFSNARNDARTWGNVPISREVNNYLKFYDKSLQKFAVLGFFNNRIFISANPYRIGALDRSQRPVSDYAHGGFVTMEIEALASFLSQGSPTWDGLWTGVNPMEIQTIGGRCFVISKDGCGPNGVNVLYELSSRDLGPDILRNGVKRPIRSIVYTRDYTFADQGIDSQFTEKREKTFSVQVQNVQGEFKLGIERKPSHFNNFVPLGSWKHSAPASICDGVPEGALLNGIAPHQFKPLIFGDGEEACDPITQELNSTFISLQYRLTVEGENWSIQKVKSKAELIKLEERQLESMCEELPDTKLPVPCSPDWIIPGAKIC